MIPGNRLELQDALELALEGAFVVEILAIDDLTARNAPVTPLAIQTSP